MQLYREEARYLERTAPWIERVGLSHVRERIVDDAKGRGALCARFLESQKYSQTDPWAERAAGKQAEEFAPLRAAVRRDRSACRMSWIDVGPLDGVARSAARAVVRVGAVSIAVFRTSTGDVFALRDQCPHRGGPLSQGIVHGDARDVPAARLGHRSQDAVGPTGADEGARRRSRYASTRCVSIDVPTRSRASLDRALRGVRAA